MIEIRPVDQGVSNACNCCGITEAMRGANLAHLRFSLRQNVHQAMQLTLCTRCRRELFEVLSPGQAVTVLQANDYAQGVRIRRVDAEALARNLNQTSKILNETRPETNVRQYWQTYEFLIGDPVKNPGT